MAGRAWNVDNLNGGLAPPPAYIEQASAGEEKPLISNLERSTSKLQGRVSKELAGQLSNRMSLEYNSQLQKQGFQIDLDPDGQYAAVDMAPKATPRWIIMPQCQFRRTWVMITLVVAFYIIWVTPIRVGFDMQAQGPWFWIEGLIDIFFYIDLVLNFFTAYENPVTSEVITNHKLIAKRYLSSWFWIDLLATFPSDYIVKGVSGTWGCSFRDDCPPGAGDDTAISIIVLLRTMRIFRIVWIFKNFNVLSVQTLIGRVMDELITMRWVFSVAELLVVLIFLGHMCGCFFYMFSHPKWQTPTERELISEGELSTWVLDKAGGYDIQQMPSLLHNANGSNPIPDAHTDQDPKTGAWYSCSTYYNIYTCSWCSGMQLRCKAQLGFGFRYISAMYWAYTTMTTVGYGDIYATTIAEKVWAMFTMVIGGFFLSFCFGRIASIVSRLDADRAARAEQMESVSQFLKDHELPKPISRKVIEFFKTNVKGVKPYDRAAMLARMPFDLRSGILQYLYDTCIKNIPMLHEICMSDNAFMADFTIRLQPYHTSADTFVYQRGELTADVYILIRGDVHVWDSTAQTRLARIQEGTIFGEANFVKHMQGAGKTKRDDSVKCDTPCDMLRLSLEDCSALCDIYPQLAQGLSRLDRTRQQQLALKDKQQQAAASTHSTSQPAPCVRAEFATPFGSMAQLHTDERPAAGRSGRSDTTTTELHDLQATCQELRTQVAELRSACVEQQTWVAQELSKQGQAMLQLPSKVVAQLQGVSASVSPEAKRPGHVH